MEIMNITADIVCLVFMVIILLGVTIGTKEKITTTKIYIVCLVLEIIGLVVDAISFVSDPGMDGETKLMFDVMAYVICMVLVFFISFYIISVVHIKGNVGYKHLIVPGLICCIDMAMMIIGTINGEFYYVLEDESYPGPWELYVSILTFCLLIYLIIALCRNIKDIGKQQILKIGTYFIFPLAIVSLQLIFTDLDFTYAGLGASLMIMYVMIQAESIAESGIREKVLKEASYVDSLTGLKNRRAYDEIVDDERRGIRVFVLFCDLNGLKQINDEVGHTAGDELIINFSNILKEHFYDGEVCRISGDEFVVIIYNLTEDQVAKRIKLFNEVIEKNDRMAATGYVYRENDDLLGIIKEAEKIMYADKERYYIETGKDRRKL
ncbi:MAG: GGDEF domain-containing protein [Lachnospiraceae bacterium]|nr:GGDEF domain-containing protein [Lachnospiraceae bacterium]